MEAVQPEILSKNVYILIHMHTHIHIYIISRIGSSEYYWLRTQRKSNRYVKEIICILYLFIISKIESLAYACNSNTWEAKAEESP